MANNVIAYVGIDYFDHIIYTARILVKLGMKVLIVDHSDTLALLSSIPIPKGISVHNDIITFKKMDFTLAEISQTLLEAYDDILISYGFKKPTADIAYCNRIVYVTDLYRYNHTRLKKYCTMYHLDNITNRELVIKDVIESKVPTDMIAERIGVTFPDKNITVLLRDDNDYYNSIINHTNNSFYFARTSKQLRRHLIQETGILYPNLKPKQLSSACQRAGKGEV